MSESNTNPEHPSAIKVGLFLCLASIAFGILVTILETITGIVFSSSGFLSTIVPCMAVGAWFGQKSGQLMPSDTRWHAILIWVVFSILVFAVIAAAMGVSVIELFAEMGALSIIILIVMGLVTLLSYFLLKSGEKMGIKTRENAQKKKARQ